ncbi:FAD/NAD(P)-binding domain-containing protein [Pseudohyphozyma bogoriensis]|nr:FAD/NAD(P)-binding domain-containing protein [Pseudohyphozyma bogoriensis]
MPHATNTSDYWELPPRHLREAGKEVQVYERAAACGGAWLFTNDRPHRPAYPATVAQDADFQPDLPPPSASLPYTIETTLSSIDADAARLEHAPPAPAYKTLKNNIPSPIMVFQDFPKPKDGPWYLWHHQHLAYLQEYAKSFDLNSLVSYNTRVEKVEEEFGPDGVAIGWNVLTKKMELIGEGESRVVRCTWSSKVFDAVVSANGHHTAESVPNIPGLDEWQRVWPERLSHARSFRTGEDWAGQDTVLVVGSGPSGSDMAREICRYAQRVLMTTRPFLEGDSEDAKIVKTVMRERLPKANGLHVPAVVRFLPPTDLNGPGTIEMLDGKTYKVDSVLFTTGYHYSNPYLVDYEQRMIKQDPANKMMLDGHTVLNLHEQVFYISNPTLALVGVPVNVSTFSFYEYLSLMVTRVWSGQAQLPSIPCMRAEFEAKFAASKPRTFHVYGKPVEVALVQEMSDWINSEAARLGFEGKVRRIEPYSPEYLAIKARTVEGLKGRDREEEERMAAQAATEAK